MATVNGKATISPTPPYVPFKTFLNFLEKLEQLVPPRIDRSFLNRYYSGTMGSMLLIALRFLGLIEGEDHRVTDALERLVNEKASRKQLLKELLHDRYGPVFSDVGDLSKATHGLLEQSFKQRYKIDGETRRKAISFFVHAAQETGIPVSMYIRTASNPGPRAASKPGPRKARQGNMRTVDEDIAAPKSATSQGATHQANSVNGQTKTIKLRKGDSLTLIYSGDVLGMDRQDRDLLFQITDLMDSHLQEIPRDGMYDEGIENIEEEELE